MSVNFQVKVYQHFLDDQESNTKTFTLNKIVTRRNVLKTYCAVIGEDPGEN